MTAQIIRFSDHHDAIRIRREKPPRLSFVWPGILAYCVIVWAIVWTIATRGF